MDRRDLPPELPVEEVWQEMLERVSVQTFIRENFGLYSPPADYAALRAENMRRRDAAQRGNSPQKRGNSP